jgi:Leucine-rich repeat (LRR) protein
VLDLQANSVAGQIPHHLCHPGSKLEMLKVRNNQLRGPLDPLTDCTALTQLDVSGNTLSGGLAEVEPGNWSKLVVLDASHNQLTGSIPPEVYHLPVLAYLSLAHNR